ncbi:MAG: hypothetical protein LPK07_11485 [Hymenobacteraceae bacterium]|nr:hypothetical protein [Hymenobacteraceae bacterium]MDX5482293.1 hypothetical protein [Hymenobacteraceae bacterium]
MMKKVIAVGSLCLALGMASCKTYCPAYNYAKVETDAKMKVTAEVTDKATDDINS